MASDHIKRIIIQHLFIVLFTAGNILAPLTSWAKQFDSQVLSVESGNLITLLLSSGERRHLQLIGIAPSMNRAEARISRRHLHMLLAGKFVTIDYRTLTADGVLLGRVFHGGADINRRMLASGMACFKSDAPLLPEQREIYTQAQSEARTRHLGICGSNQL